MIDQALDQVMEIEEELKALKSDLSGVAKNMPRNDLQRQVVKHCAAIETLDTKMNSLFSTLKLAKSEAEELRDGQ